METEAKYYVPSDLEFCIGFEYECSRGVKGIPDEHWMKYTFPNVPHIGVDWGTENPFSIVSRIKFKRVKYLDSKDIESLGFKLIFSDIGIEYWKLGNFELRTDVDLGAYIDSDNLYSIFYNPYGKQYNCMFSGIIKNKSELKQVLKMIGVQ